jgi:hypothetical protein
MRFDQDKEFEQNMNQLIQLLKKILASPLSQGKKAEYSNWIKKEGANLNVYFFTFFPLAPEELDELEEIYDRFLFDEEVRPEDLTTDLTSMDLDFLRRNGIQF